MKTFTPKNLPLGTYIIQMEKSELLALLWSVETATDLQPKFDCEEDRGAHDQLCDDAYAIHGRLQDAWANRGCDAK